MNSIKLLGIASLLAANMLQAGAPCNNFEIKIKNNLADDLLVTSIFLNGAKIQPRGLQTLRANSTEAFVINDSKENIPMKGNFEFKTISLPIKTVKINYSLVNNTLACEHSDHPVEGNDYAVEKTRLPGNVEYMISNK